VVVVVIKTGCRMDPILSFIPTKMNNDDEAEEQNKIEKTNEKEKNTFGFSFRKRSYHD